MSRPANGYLPAIMDAVVGIDADEAAVVEELMRVEHPTLDHLDSRRFNRLARDSKMALDILRHEDPVCAAFYERQAS